MSPAQEYFGHGIKTILAEKGLDANSELWEKRLEKVGTDDVERALSEPAGCYSLEKLLVLVSPTAENYLEEMAQLAHQLTIQRFG
ncbi:MAG: hypothetical protein ACYSTJ_04595, partial [Planctomycetota bacterium]